jgi:hypothetical protein
MENTEIIIDTSKIDIDIHSQNLKHSNNSPDFVDKRNRRLMAFFISLGYVNNIKMFGMADNPSIIYNNNILLSCYVNNFNLVFNESRDYNSLVLFKIKLMQRISISESRIKHIKKWINTDLHKKVFKIKTDSNLYLAGYNYIIKNKPDTKYPVFAPYNPRIFLKREYAENSAKILENYNIAYTIE